MDGLPFKLKTAVTISGHPDAVWTIERKKAKSVVLFRNDPVLNRLIWKRLSINSSVLPRQA
jgi:hypothetical protein